MALWTVEMDRASFMVVHRTRESSSLFVSKRFPTVRRLSSRMSERNGYRDPWPLEHIVQRGVVTQTVLARLFNWSTTYQHWPSWPYCNILVVSLTHKVSQLQQWLPYSFMADSTIWLHQTFPLYGIKFHYYEYPQFVLLETSDWLEVLLQMKDVLNFATTMPGAPSVMMDLMKMMPMWSAVSLAILIKVTFN